MNSITKNCEREISQLTKEIKTLKAKLKTAKEDDIDYIDYMIEIKQQRIGDLNGQIKEIEYIDNGKNF